mmetsp:Transcript_10362/g.21003  ORF Transcript_10362/g.21003 Transcript_10362/m.21003 type:complete len:392 (+) Transcript_10362:359-1534(+)
MMKFSTRIGKVLAFSPLIGMTTTTTTTMEAQGMMMTAAAGNGTRGMCARCGAVGATVADADVATTGYGGGGGGGRRQGRGMGQRGQQGRGGGGGGGRWGRQELDNAGPWRQGQGGGQRWAQQGQGGASGGGDAGCWRQGQGRGGGGGGAGGRAWQNEQGGGGPWRLGQGGGGAGGGPWQNEQGGGGRLRQGQGGGGRWRQELGVATNYVPSAVDQSSPPYGRGQWQQQQQQQGEGCPCNNTDHDTIQNLINNRQLIQRTVEKTADGIQTHTWSDEKQVSDWITEHVYSMKKRMEDGDRIRQRDPLFVAAFDHAHLVKDFIVEEQGNGVTVTETSTDPCTIDILHSHADVVTAFIDHGRYEVRRNHPVPSSCDAVTPRPCDGSKRASEESFS